MRGEDMPRSVTAFAGQNWLITPAGSTADQDLLLVLSGVAIPNVRGTSDWFEDTLIINPDLGAPLNYAINRFGIQRPSGLRDGIDYFTVFSLEQWAPFAGLSAIFDQDQAVNAGFAVQVWRPYPFSSAADLAGQPVNNIFTGIEVDVAVRDSDAWLYRVSYNIALLGRIRFTRFEF
jgi:hypothetical protein